MFHSTVWHCLCGRAVTTYWSRLPSSRACPTAGHRPIGRAVTALTTTTNNNNSRRQFRCQPLLVAVTTATTGLAQCDGRSVPAAVSVPQSTVTPTTRCSNTSIPQAAARWRPTVRTPVNNRATEPDRAMFLILTQHNKPHRPLFYWPVVSFT